MVDFQYNDEPLLALIADRLKSKSVGLIYFDIAEFSQIERTYGSQVCEQILSILNKTVTRVTPALITYRIIGDDFFLYTALPHAEESEVLQILRNLCKEIKLVAEQAVITELPVLKDFTLHVGCDIIPNNQSKHLHYVVYSASIRSILECITNVKMENARFANANPLTGLPGNLQIQHEIQGHLFVKEPFAVIYVDLDNFKSFNDLFGYQKGDQLIQYTSDVLKRDNPGTETNSEMISIQAAKTKKAAKSSPRSVYHVHVMN